MRFLVILAVLTLLIGAFAAGPAASDGGVYIYRGSPVSQSGITLGGWGSGSAAETTERILTGSQSIKIVSQGLYAGGRLDFAQPITLFSEGVDPTQYILFTFFFNDTETVDLAAQTGYWYDIDPYMIPKAKHVRFLFESDNGLWISAEEPTGTIDLDDNWLRMAVPMAKFKLPEGVKQFRLKRMSIASDGPGTALSPATMFLGEAKIVKDDRPIKVDPIGSQTIALGDEVVLLAEADGGMASLKYSWDWDASNGIQEETLDRVGRVTYTKGGEYVVTLTVSDVDGLKKPVSVTGTITVND